MERVTVICGGVGAARFLRGLVRVVPPGSVTAVVNVADDTVLHGLEVSPDLDTIVYTLAEEIDPDRGWGLRGESWRAVEQVRRYASANDLAPDRDGDATGWFSLGDRDLGTHLYRTSRRRAGVPLSQVTREIARAWGVEAAVVPVTDDPLRTVLTTTDGERLAFQEYFVRERHSVAVGHVAVDGSAAARPAPGVLEAIAGADAVVVAPSNPVVSVEPVLAVPGVREAVSAARDRTVAISPIVGGAALKGPADRLLRELGEEPSAAGVARRYAQLAATLVIDEVDAALADRVAAAGLRPVVAPTVMSDPQRAADLAARVLEAVA